MSNKKVSIIIPTYKRPHTLKRAIESVLNQSYQNIEIIIVDDNNNEDFFRIETEKVMEEYAKDKRVIYLKHKFNKNGAAARNTGIKRATGEYIAFLDDDDEFFPQKISKQVAKLESLDDSWGCCYTAYLKELENKTIQKSAENREGNLVVEALMRTLYIYAGSNLVVRKKVVDEIGGYDENFIRNQDLEFLVRILKNYKIAYVDDYLLKMNYDARVSSFTLEQQLEREKLFQQTFKNEIDSLSKENKERIHTMFKLDTFRLLLLNKKYTKAISFLIINKVPSIILLKYIYYLFSRLLTNKCYGFSI